MMFFVLPYIALAVVIILSWLRLEKKEARFLLIATGVALFIHIIYALCIQRMPVARYGRFFFIDEYAYDLYSWAIAHEWHMGHFPRLWTDQYLGTLHTGWNRILAAIYYVFGHHPRLGIALNIFAGALLVPLSFFTTRQLFLRLRIADCELRNDKAHPSTPIHNSPFTILHSKFPLMHSPAAITALITAVHFSFAYWCAFLLRDTILAVMFLAALYLVLQIYGRPNLWAGAALILILCGLAILRVYSVGALLAGVLAYLLFFHKYKKWMWLGAFAGVILAIVARVYIPIRDYEDQLIYTFLNNLPDAGRTPLGSLIYCARGIPRFFLGPYAWYVSPGAPVIDYMLYPGQWLLYLLILPFGLKGLWICIRENTVQALFLVIPIMLSIFLFLLAYQGSVPRQRLYLEPLFIVFSAWGIYRKDKACRIPLYWYVFLVLFIAAHSYSAYRRGLW